MANEIKQTAKFDKIKKQKHQLDIMVINIKRKKIII